MPFYAPRSRSVVVRLPFRALWITLAAFVAGLALFGIVWLKNRHDDTFYTVKPADKSAETVAIEPLPEPMAAQNNPSGMPTAAPGTQANGASGTFQQPALEQNQAQSSSTSSASDNVAAQAAPASEAKTPANREIPLPIDGQSPPPAYPPGALRRGETGTALVRIQVDADGNPAGVALIKRSGSRELDRAAMEAVRKWHFQPAVQDGKPVAGSVDVPVEFNLER